MVSPNASARAVILAVFDDMPDVPFWLQKPLRTRTDQKGKPHANAQVELIWE